MMDLLITILQAAHCRSTHQYFVLDALPLITTSRGQLLGRILLKHYDQYLLGSKDPDKKFRDFRNHVVHVQDGYWGGAMKTAEVWYRNLIDDLDTGRWPEAAYSAGVLSHYFTDPVMPLHTAQSDVESVVHRPMEWSVVKSYARIHQQWEQGHHKIVFELAQGQGWLSQAIKTGAEVANRYYQELIDRYDLQAGVRTPTEGFDAQSIDILAGLFGLATTGWAKILERAADESKAQLPNVSLTVASIVATIKMPTRWITRRIESSQERAAVQAIFDEYQATGQVKHNLPEEVQVVKAERESDRVAQQRQRVRREQSQSQPAATDPLHTASPIARAETIPATDKPATEGSQANQRSASRQQSSLALRDDLVDAPSIGPKTAKRFAAVGITTVEQFLKASPETMERDLATTWITAEKIADWQSQARLVCAIPSLCGYKAQLLVAVGIESADALSTRVASALHRELQQVAKTSAGKRILRSSKVPDVDDVQVWIADANELVRTKRSA
jgi:predicted flap endonuclease-1-like 5' DNA nuclease